MSTTPSKAARRKALGRAIDRADDEIDALATVTDALIAESRDWWREAAPAGFEDMLDAQPKEPKR